MAQGEIPWKQMTRVRHCIVHECMGVDNGISGEAATLIVQPLARDLEAIVPPAEG